MATGGVSVADLEQEKSEINALLGTPLRRSEVWYLLDNHWFKQWKRFVGYDSWEKGTIGDVSLSPGPIDNTTLLNPENNEEIAEHLIEDLDFVLVPEEAWQLLVNRYHLAEGQRPIPRKVVEHGVFVKHCKVEVYLMEFKLCLSSDMDHVVTKKFSKADTISHIEQEMRKIFEVPDNKTVRLWNRYTTNTYEQLAKKEATVQDTGLFQGQVLVLEMMNDDGTWTNLSPSSVFGNNSHTNENRLSTMTTTTPSITSGSLRPSGGNTRYGNTYGGSYSYGNESSASNALPGCCGLSNLGNTCFLNSALQCMSNVPPLTLYFIEDRYIDEVNTENPLGMRGEIARTYADLIKTMWSGRHAYTTPRNFKLAVGKFAPQFSGYQQQDSQELMAFLLDGLHEDLNRIKKKPYIELKDSDGQADEVVAREAWDNYRRRNDSVIVDTFHGLLKSTLVCPECSKVSVTFDPFCYLTLPMPTKKERQIELFFSPMDPNSKLFQYKVTVPAAGRVIDLCTALGKMNRVPTNRMLVADVYSHKFHKVFNADEPLTNIQDRDDIFVFELPISRLDDGERIILPVYFRLKRQMMGYTPEKKFTTNLFGHPIVICVPKHRSTYDSLYEAVLRQTSRYLKSPSSAEELQKVVHPDSIVNGDVGLYNGDETSQNGESNHRLNEDTTDEPMDDSENNPPPPSTNPSKKPALERPAHNYLFTMSFVNISGNSEVDPPLNPGSPVQFPTSPFLGVDFVARVRDHYYDERLAEALDQHESMQHRPPTRKQVLQLNECLDLYTATERLSAEDSWYCPTCKKHQQATKKFDLWQLPLVLVLSFKRFSYNRYNRDKIDTLVEFPAKGLNMQQWIINKNQGPTTYDLIAVSNHYGGMGGGHYTAYAKNKDDQRWYYFDDSSVSPALEEQVVTKAAYILVYMRSDIKHLRRSSSPSPAALGAPPPPLSNGSSASTESKRGDDPSDITATVTYDDEDVDMADN